jgi:hypothetical protein
MADNKKIRTAATVILFVSVLLMPWYITVILAAVSAVIFPGYIELIFIAVFSDILYGRHFGGNHFDFLFTAYSVAIVVFSSVFRRLFAI